PSGAGKTTLLKSLNGYEPPTQGEVLFNGHNIYECYRHYARDIGYVPQDDIVHRDLTVFEALKYSARLRLPDHTTDKEVDLAVERVLAELGLDGKDEIPVR